MSKLDPDVEQVLLALVRGLNALNVRFCVVGALVPELLLDERPPQATFDADAIVFVPDLAIFQRVRQELVGFRPDEKRPYRLQHKGGGRADILPYSAELAREGILKLEPNYVFNMTGFDRVADAIVQVTLDSGEQVPVVTVPMYVLLKLVAFTDRKLQKDIDGVQHCLRNYAKNDDRRYGLEDDGGAVPFEYGSAYLLGIDARPFVDDKMRALVAPLMERLVPTDIDTGDDDQPYREREDRAYLRWFRKGIAL